MTTDDIVRDLVEHAGGLDAVAFMYRFTEATGHLQTIQRIKALRQALEPLGLRGARDAIVDWAPGGDPAVLAPLTDLLPPVGTWTPCPEPWTAGVPGAVPLPHGWRAGWSSADRGERAVLADWLETRGDPRARAIGRADWAVEIGCDPIGLWARGALPGGTVRLRWVPGGVFARGRAGSLSTMRPHTIELTRGFWLGETPVPAAALDRRSRRLVRGQKQDAIHYVTWDAAQALLERFAPHLPARLPTEAEWECACRAGTAGDLWTGSSDLEYDLIPGPVATRPPNPLGIFDLIGCVHEWVADGYAVYGGDAVDPLGVGADRILRGSRAAWCREPVPAHVSAQRPDHAALVGLRIAISE